MHVAVPAASTFKVSPRIGALALTKVVYTPESRRASPLKTGLKAFASAVPDREYLIIRYLLTHRRFPRLTRPTRFSEWIVNRMLQEPTELMRRTSDKVRVKEYVADVLGVGFTPETYLVTEELTPEQFDALPATFILKASHASGLTKIVRDKRRVTHAALDRIVRSWCSIEYSTVAREPVYRGLRKRVIFEQLLARPDGGVPDDYKFYVFNGRLRLCHVDSDRFGNHRQTYYDENWTRVGLTSAVPEGATVARPPSFEVMKGIAERLGTGFQFVRVDLYDVAGQPYLGELTHFPMAGNKRFRPDGFDQLLLSYLEMAP